MAAYDGMDLCACVCFMCLCLWGCKRQQTIQCWLRFSTVHLSKWHPFTWLATGYFIYTAIVTSFPLCCNTLMCGWACVCVCETSPGTAILRFVVEVCWFYVYLCVTAEPKSLQFFRLPPASDKKSPPKNKKSGLGKYSICIEGTISKTWHLSTHTFTHHTHSSANLWLAMQESPMKKYVSAGGRGKKAKWYRDGWRKTGKRATESTACDSRFFLSDWAWICSQLLCTFCWSVFL